MQLIFSALFVGVLVWMLNSCGGSSEPGKPKTLTPSEQITEDKRKARVACRVQLRMSAKYPDHVDITYAKASQDGGGWAVVAKGTMRNGFGLDAPFNAMCLVDGVSFGAEVIALN